MNKKGQAQVIATIPVMFLVFLVLFIFVVLSYTLGLKLGVRGDVAAQSSNAFADDFLFQELNVSGSQMTVANVFLRWANVYADDEVYGGTISRALRELIEKQVVPDRGSSGGQGYAEGAFAGYQGSSNGGFVEFNCVGMTYSGEGRDFLWRTAAGVNYASVLLWYDDVRGKIRNDVSIPSEGVKEIAFIVNDQKFIGQYYYTNCEESNE